VSDTVDLQCLVIHPAAPSAPQQGDRYSRALIGNDFSLPRGTNSNNQVRLIRKPIYLFAAKGNAAYIEAQTKAYSHF